MKSRILLFILSFLAASCIDVEICDESYESELVAKFKIMHAEGAVDSTVAALTLYGIKEGQNDTLYDALPSSGFVVPLDPNHDFSRFVIQINDQTDTLIISYHYESYMMSYTCGFANLFTLENIEPSSGIIKSDTILNEMIDAEYEEDEEHIWLYL
jgi:hypothetical protein